LHGLAAAQRRRTRLRRGRLHGLAAAQRRRTRPIAGTLRRRLRHVEGPRKQLNCDRLHSSSSERRLTRLAETHQERPRIFRELKVPTLLKRTKLAWSTTNIC
jgi:hypothetical protein